MRDITAPHPDQHVAPAPPPPPTPAKPVRILILEDDPAHVEAVRRAFLDSGMKAVIHLARNLRDYRALAASHPPDIAIVDLQLPDGKATDILTSPAEAGPFPILIMSGYGDERIAVEAMKAGAIDYFEKSFGTFAAIPRAVESSLRAWNVLQERKRAEEQLRESEEKYRVLFEGSTHGILITDIETRRFVFANPSMCRMLGYSAAELLKLGVADIHPKDALARIMTGMKTQLREGKSLSSGIPCLRKDGTGFFADIGGANTIVNGRRCIVGFFADVTERRRAEEALRESELRYRALFENMQEGFAYYRMLYDEQERPVDFVYLGVNRAFELLTGLKNVVGKPVSEVIPGLKESNPELFERYGRVASTGKPDKFEIYFEPLKQWLSISAYSPVKGHFAAVFENITERKRTVELLRKQRRKLRASAKDLKVFSQRLIQVREQERRNLSYLLHHEAGTLAFLLRRQLTGALPDIRARRPGRALGALAEGVSLLDRHVAALKKYAGDLRPPDLDGLGLVKAVKYLYADASEKAGLRVSFQFRTNRHRFDTTASIIVYRVAQEALNNVLAHGAATSVSLSLAVRDGSIRLLVRDNGKGFHPDRALKADRKSMGLRSMKEMAEILGGRVDVRSAPGKGTSIALTLPARPAAAKRPSPSPSSTPIPRPRSPNSQ